VSGDLDLSGRYDAVVIGSGFGGCFAALPLVEAGHRVLMLERGDWVDRGPANWGDEGAFVLTPHYTTESLYSLATRTGARPQGICACVGGPSVFYGGAAFRFREEDFATDPRIAGDSGAAWPLSYADLEPYYGLVERMLGVSGETGRDPTEPPRSSPYPHPPGPLAEPSRRVAAAAASLGLAPFRIPMAIDAAACVRCTTCDAFACAIGAKNDLATTLVPRLLAGGMELRARAVAVRLVRAGGRVVAVEAVDSVTREAIVVAADRVIVAAGALATPHLLIASELHNRNPASAAVGRYLMRHCNAMTYGVYPEPPNPGDEHHKQIAIHDYYFGDPALPRFGKLGNIQQVMAPPVSLVRAMLPRSVGAIGARLLRRLTGLLVIAEDQPRAENAVEVDRRTTDPYGLPAALIRHRYTRRDLAARRALLRRAREVLRASGARFTLTWKVSTFSHAVGTVRMGRNPATAPLDPECRFRGVENLWVTDGSVFPTSGGVNPSLTIAANALRVGTLLSRQ
jgi:choline dehydrogenase-like flavoprotein